MDTSSQDTATSSTGTASTGEGRSSEGRPEGARISSAKRNADANAAAAPVNTSSSEAGEGEDARGGHTPAASLKAKHKHALTSDIAPREKVDIDLRSLLQAGAHFGHQTSRWSPQMAPFIYTSRNGIHIINLPKTIQSWKRAHQAIVETVAAGGNILFVGTKKQAQEAVVEEARRCGAFYVSQRWLGGMITNFQTIRKSIDRLNKIEQTLEEDETAMREGRPPRFKKKERLMMSKEKEKLDFSIGGIRSMYAPPQMIFVIDIKREDIAVKEARRLDIPVVALVDTNCDPTRVNFAIPSNDDGTRAIRLFCSAVADAVMEGKALQVETKPARGREGRNNTAAIEARAKMVSDFAAQATPAVSDAAPQESLEVAEQAGEAVSKEG